MKSSALEELVDPPGKNDYPSDSSEPIIHDRLKYGRNVGAQIVARAAEDSGASAVWLDGRRAVLSQGEKRILVQGFFGTESPVGASICKNKVLTKQVLQDAGVSTPPGCHASSVKEALEFWNTNNGPVVVKPIAGNKGRAVRVDLNTSDEIRDAFQHAAGPRGALVEADIRGKIEYRCIATPDECLSVVHRVLPWVVGDGESTIESLIAKTNQRRQNVPSTVGRLIPVDAITVSCLQDQGLALDSVLPAGKRITVRNVGGLSSGGVPIEVSGTAPKSVPEIAVAAIAAIPGLDWGGVDVMVSEDGTPYVIEVNTDADFSGAQFPHYGTPKAIGPALYAKRMEAAVPEDEVATTILSSVRPSVRLRGALPAFSEPRRLSELLAECLESAGWNVERHPLKVVEARRSGNRSIWLSICSTTEDLAVVRATLKRHLAVRKLLKISGIKIPKGVVARSLPSAEKVIARGGSWAILPAATAWDESRARAVAAKADLRSAVELTPFPWFMQARPVGSRLRVFATRVAPLAVTSRSRDISEHDLEDACRVAVASVRSVPGLRWAAVDMLIVAQGARKGTVLVEGIPVDPVLDPSDFLLAGDIDRVFSTVLGNSLSPNGGSVPEGSFRGSQGWRGQGEHDDGERSSLADATGGPNTVIEEQDSRAPSLTYDWAAHGTPEDARATLTMRDLAQVLSVTLPRTVNPRAEISYVAYGPTSARPGSVCFLPTFSTRAAKRAMRSGAALLVVPRPPKSAYGASLPLVVCDDLGRAYTDVIAHVRERFDPAVIAITGSVGKTTLKEMLRLVCGEELNTLHNRRNANVPRRVGEHVQKLTSATQVYIQETGAAHPGTVARSSEMLKPSAFVVTNVGLNHIGDYGGERDALLRDKLSHDTWLQDGGVAFLNLDDSVLSQVDLGHDIVSFAVNNPEADYVAENAIEENGEVAFDAVETATGVRERLRVKTLGLHNVYNALAAFAVGRWLGIPADVIRSGLLKYRATGTRQNLMITAGERVLVDCYNSSEVAIGSLVTTLSSMSLRAGESRILVLGDIDDKLGERTESVHRRVGEKLAGASRIDEIILFGEHMQWAADEARRNGRQVFHTTDRETLHRYISDVFSEGDVLAFKGGQHMSLATTIDTLFATDLILEDTDELRRRSTPIRVGNFRFRVIRELGAEFVGVTSGFDSTGLQIPASAGGTPNFLLGPECAQGLSIERLDVPAPVRTISARAFENCSSLALISLPPTLRHIGPAAFKRCESLRHLHLPDGLLHIGAEAFRGCSQLETVYLPGTLKQIDEGAFEDCESLARVYCPTGSSGSRVVQQTPLKALLVKSPERGTLWDMWH